MALKNLANLVNKITKDKPLNEEFLFDLISTIERMDKPRIPSKAYKPSSLGGCLRNIYYQVTGEQPDLEQRGFTNIGITESGSDRHERIQGALMEMKKMGYDCEWISVADFIKSRKPSGTRVVEEQGAETKCYNDILKLSFLCDGLVKYKGKYYIIEIKTEASFKFLKNMGPYAEHEVQATCYSVCLGVDDILFIYENRDTCDKKVHHFVATDELKQRLVVDKIETCNSYVERNVVPPKSDIKKDCTYCKYKAQCKRDGD